MIYIFKKIVTLLLAFFILALSALPLTNVHAYLSSTGYNYRVFIFPVNYVTTVKMETSGVGIKGFFIRNNMNVIDGFFYTQGSAGSPITFNVNGYANNVVFEYLPGVEPTSITINGGTTFYPAGTVNVDPYDVPLNVTRLKGNAGDRQVVLNWINSTSDDTKQEVYYKLSSSSTWITDTTSLSSSATTRTISNLTNGSSYDFKVVAVDSYNRKSTGTIVSSTPVSPEVVHNELSNLVTTPFFNKVSLSWSIPSTNPNFTGSKVYKNGTLIKTLDKNTKVYTDNTVKELTDYTYKITATYSDNFETTGISKTTTTLEAPKPVGDVTSLKVDPFYNQVKLSWVLPEDENFSKVKVYRDNVFLKETESTTFVDETVSSTTEYNYKITTVAKNGLESAGVTKTIMTPAPKPAGDITKIIAKPSYNRVDLSWTNPNDATFNKVKIYRNKITDTSAIEKVLFGQSVYAAGTPIFETNGTTFNDLTVVPDTKYEYTLKTVADNGLYSDGVTVTAVTLPEPAPVIKGEGYSKNENGDYLFSWSEPKLGKVKVLLAGQVYKTIDASLLNILIPKTDMQYDFLGNPNVSLVPVSESGKEGTAEKPLAINGEDAAVSTPFTVSDLVSASAGLLWFVGPFLLLALSFIFFPKFRKIIFSSLGKGGKTKGTSETKRRFEDATPKSKDLQDKKQREIQKKKRLERKERQEKEYLARIEQQEIATAIAPVVKEPRKTRETHVKAFKMPRQERAAREPRQSRVPRERSRSSRTPRRER